MADQTAPRNRYSRAKRLRAHVNYEDMSVSYGRVKLAVPTGFKEMLETVTREILREQPRDIPRFLAKYFEYMNENQKRGIKTGNLVTERIVEANKTAEASTQDETEKTEPIVTQSNTCQTDVVQQKESESTTEDNVEKSIIEPSNPDTTKSAPIVSKSEESENAAVTQSVGNLLEKTLSTMEDTTPGPSRTALPVISNSQISVASISDIKCGDTKIITVDVIEKGEEDRQSLTETISKQSLREIAQETADAVTTEANTNQASLEREIEEIDVDVDYKVEGQVEKPNETETEEEIIDETPVCENYNEESEGKNIVDIVKSETEIANNNDESIEKSETEEKMESSSETKQDENKETEQCEVEEKVNTEKAEDED